MTDIVERWIGPDERHAAALAAKDAEIERLLKLLAIEGLSCKVVADIERQQATIERLTAALMELRGVAQHNDVLIPGAVVEFIDAALTAPPQIGTDSIKPL